MPFVFSDEHFDLAGFLDRSRGTRADRLVLFGAGGWGVALLEELERRRYPLPVVFADNDRTKWGKRLGGRDILPPGGLRPAGDLVVITTISAGDAISSRLERLGFIRDVTYFQVMRRQDLAYPLESLKFFRSLAGDLGGLRVLHVGPGGHLGVELFLAAATGRPVDSVEYGSFGLRYPEVTPQAPYYRKLDEIARAELPTGLFKSGLLVERDARLFVNAERVRLLLPCSVTELPYAADTFDLVLHRAVFEHVLRPERGYREIFRVLKPGGRTAGLVDPQDHRAQGGIEGMHPLAYLTMSREEWRSISAEINPHNQWTAPEHRRAIREAGFAMTAWNILQRMDIPNAMWAGFHESFRALPREEVGGLRFSFVGTKPGKSRS